ncbi:MAG: hypothetical protein WC979_02835 [Candidatus Pacearchaeota archaeon]|jgi:hypothetical protein|nr:hypothetical protein [Clostridia bacterium]
MEIILSKKEAEEYFHSALCNGGISEFQGYGLRLDYMQSDYLDAKCSLKAKMLNNEIPSETICFEDVLVEILRNGKTLQIIDEECEGEYNREITLEMVHENYKFAPATTLIDYVEGNDDACTADSLLQSIVYQEVIFG